MPKRFDKATLASAAVISALLFVAGVSVGININEQKTSFLRDRIVDLNSDLESVQLEFLLLDTIGENATCPLLRARINEVNKETYELGQRLLSYEETSKFTDEGDLDSLKQDYYRSLIRYWLLNKKVEEACSERTLSVIFFFVPDCPSCDDQSVVLDYYKTTLGEDILIFTLNAAVDDPFIQTLAKNFEVSRYPTLIVDDTKYEGFQSRETFRAVICEKQPGLETCQV